jgi:hypothetical protein
LRLRAAAVRRRVWSRRAPSRSRPCVVVTSAPASAPHVAPLRTATVGGAAGPQPLGAKL